MSSPERATAQPGFEDQSVSEEDEPAGMSLRISGLKALKLTPRRKEERRLAAAIREVIELLVSTTATEVELAGSAIELEALATRLRTFPAGQSYRGFAESANAGQEVAGVHPDGAEWKEELAEELVEHGKMVAGGLLPGDPEWYAFFDHSPFIGLANPLSPPVELEYAVDKVLGRVTFGSAYEGPPGCVHGGYIAAVFDEVLGSAQSLSGEQGMTAHLGIDYRRPTPLQVPLVFEGWLDRSEGRKIYARATLHAEGELTAEAGGLFIAFDTEKFKALLESRNKDC
ncbi:MAG: PaaI family thioesterase [Actinomycetes bacterium]